MKDFLIVIFFTGIIITTVLGIAASIHYYSCTTYGKATGREVKYEGLSCYGKIDGVWYSASEYKKLIVPNRQKIEFDK